MNILISFLEELPCSREGLCVNLINNNFYSAFLLKIQKKLVKFMELIWSLPNLIPTRILWVILRKGTVNGPIFKICDYS